MIRNAQSILKQSVDKNNAWYWAKDEAIKLQEAIGKVQSTSDHCQETCVTSSVHVLQKNHSAPESAGAFLEKHKEDLKAAAKEISVPLQDLNDMHKVKLRPACTGEPKAPKAKKPKTAVAA